MSVGSAAFRAHKALERVYPTPGIVDIETFTVAANTRFSNPSVITRRILLAISISLSFCYVVGRLFYILKHSTGEFPFLEVAAWCAFIPGFIIMGVLGYPVHTQSDNLHFLATQASIAKPYLEDTQTNHKIPNIRQLLVYIIMIGVLIVPLGILLSPFKVTFDPAQVMFGTSVGVKVIGGFVYFHIAFPVACGVRSFLLMSLAFLETVHAISGQCATQQSFETNYFQAFVRHFNTVILLNHLADLATGFFFSSLVMLGIPLTSATICASVKVWGYVDFIMWLMCPITTCVGFLVALIFTWFAEKPVTTCEFGLQQWKEYSHTAWKKKVLRSLRRTGIHLGPYGIATQTLGMRISDDIINNAVSLFCIFG